MRERDINDSLLDEALKSYGDPGANSGLEARMLARLDAFRRTEEPHRPARRGWFWFAIASPAVCAGLAVLAYVATLRHESVHPQAAVPASTFASDSRHAPAAETRAATEQPVRARHVAKSSARQAEAVKASPPGLSPMPLPKLAVFPSTPSLTPEERAVLRWETHAPESVRKALVEAPAEVNHPADIADIRIPPLVMPELGSE